MMSQTRLKVDEQILEINKVICKNIDAIDNQERGFRSQNILAQLRNLVEHIMLKVWNHPQDVDDSYDNICAAIELVIPRGLPRGHLGCRM